MNEILFHRYVAPAIWATGSVAAGLVLGTSTVHGMSSARYGYRATMPDSQYATYGEPPDQSLPARDAACDDCSERDLGYRWAMLRRIVSIGDCPNDSWDFRRGCAAYTRDTAGI